MDLTETLQEQVLAARAAGQRLPIRGARSRRVPAMLPQAAAVAGLELSGHAGIVDYLPAELVLTARAGTPLAELDSLLAEHGQVLPFEPVRAGTASTLGGAVATGHAGPARPWWGSTRDAVLGIRLLDGRGQVGRFGGQVMKNVAGYDVARLNVGAWGALGALLDVSVRLRPAPECALTCVLELEAEAALQHMLDMGRQALPVTGLAWDEGRLLIRLAGTEAGVHAAARRLGGSALENAADAFWVPLRDQQLTFFAAAAPVYRLSLPPDAPQPDFPAQWLLDWGGALRWCATSVPSERVQAHAQQLGGWAMQWQPELDWPVLSAPLISLHERVKHVFDPDGVMPPLIWTSES